MKLIVDCLPESPRDCLFGSNSTGKYRCKFDAHLCPTIRGGECPYLADTSDRTGSVKPEQKTAEIVPDPNRVVKKKVSRSIEKA